MSPVLTEPPLPEASSNYPQMHESDRTRIVETLAKMVSLLHPEGLDDGQLREIAANLDVQIANTEKLRRFALTNAMEPAFSIQLYPGLNDDR
jgi:hypothetical protein